VQEAGDRVDGEAGLEDLLVGAVDRGEVAQGAVAAAQDDAVRQRRLDGDRRVEAVDREVGAGERVDADPAGAAGLPGLVGAGAAERGEALAWP
jgi:hypothetical protein